MQHYKTNLLRRLIFLSVTLASAQIGAEKPQKPVHPSNYKPQKPADLIIPESPADRYVRLTDAEQLNYRLFNFKFGDSGNISTSGRPIYTFINKTQFRILSRFFNQQHADGMAQAIRYVQASCRRMQPDCRLDEWNCGFWEERVRNEFCIKASDDRAYPFDTFDRVSVYGTQWTIGAQDDNDYPIQIALLKGLNADTLRFWNVRIASLEGIETINAKTLIIQNCKLAVSELLKLEKLLQLKPAVAIQLPELRSEHCQHPDVQAMLRRNSAIRFTCFDNDANLPVLPGR
ncbi:MAG: hypothetical protein KDK39_16215 [Leptospiraceae bacterium]|nr:hypothetical protein [Leptospiraceae bacterium]